MKFRIVSKDFVKLLDGFSDLVPSKDLIPILTTVKLEATEDDRLIATCANEQMGIQREIPIKDSEYGEVCVPVKKLYELVKQMSLTDSQIDFEMLSSDRVQLKNSDMSFRLISMSVGDFPDVIENKMDMLGSLQGNSFCEMINVVSSGITTQQGRPALEGANCIFSNNSLEMCGTDGKKLVNYTKNIDSDCIYTQLTIPFIMFKSLLKICNSEDIITISQSSSSILIHVNNTKLICRKLEGDFADWQAVIASVQDVTNYIVVSREMLINAINSVNITTSPFADMVFNFNSEGLVVTSAGDAGEGSVIVSGNEGKLNGQINLSIKLTKSVIDSLPLKDIRLYLHGMDSNQHKIVVQQSDEKDKVLAIIMGLKK